MADSTFDFEGLIVYQLAVEVSRWVRRTPWPTGEGKLKDQARRAADSVALNIAEGRMRTGRARSNHYSIARGSAGEVFAALDLIDLPGGKDTQHTLHRIGKMLHALGG